MKSNPLTSGLARFAVRRLETRVWVLKVLASESQRPCGCGAIGRDLTAVLCCIGFARVCPETVSCASKHRPRIQVWPLIGVGPVDRWTVSRLVLGWAKTEKSCHLASGTTFFSVRKWWQGPVFWHWCDLSLQAYPRQSNPGGYSICTVHPPHDIPFGSSASCAALLA